MNPIDSYKDRIGDRLMTRLIDALEQGKITQQEMSEASKYILDNIDNIRNTQDILSFLENMSQKWPMLQDLLSIEEANQAETNKGQQVAQVEKLIDENKIDEALKTAEAANNDLAKGGTQNAS